MAQRWRAARTAKHGAMNGTELDQQRYDANAINKHAMGAWVKPREATRWNGRNLAHVPYQCAAMPNHTA